MRLFCSQLIICFLYLLAFGQPQAETLVIADFDSGRNITNRGLEFGTWNRDPNDQTQSCTMTFSASDVMGRKGGRSVRLEYDVDSPNPAFNGFWLKLNEPAKSFKALIFFIKGDQSAGFTKKLKAEIKFSDQQKSVYLIENITDQYKRYRLEITPPGNKSRLTEFTIVFDDQTSQPKKGAVFLDEIELEKTAP